MHSSVQAAHAPDEGTVPVQEDANTQQEQPTQERPKYSSSPGQQKFVKRMLADLVSQKPQRAASALKGLETSSTQQSDPSQGMAPASGSSNGNSCLKQDAHNQSIFPANARSSSRTSLQQGGAPQSLPSAAILSQSSSQRRLAPGEHGSSNGMHGAQQHNANQALTPTPQRPVPAPLNGKDRAGYHHSAPGQRPVPKGAHCSAGPDRTAARQGKLPFAPAMPNASPRYKTILCKHHREGRCPRGDSCSFAHGHAELRKMGGVQVRMIALPSPLLQSHAKQASTCMCAAGWMAIIAHGH